VRSGGGYASQSDLRVHFGVGSAKSVEKIEVFWPSGRVDETAATAVNRVLKLTGSAPSGHAR